LAEKEARILSRLVGRANRCALLTVIGTD